MSIQAMGKVPPYQDISHFRAPYKNAIFAGFGAGPAQQHTPTAAALQVLYFTGAHNQTWYLAPGRRDWARLLLQPHETVFDGLKALANSLAQQAGRAVAVYRTAGTQGPVGGVVYVSHGIVGATHGLGIDPMACTAPKWVYSGFADSCVCAPGFVSTPDGTDCIPLTDPNAPVVPPTGGLNTWTLTDPITGATTPVPAGTPGAVPSTTTPAATACTGYQVGSTCVPTWALWLGGGLAALLVVDMVL